MVHGEVVPRQALDQLQRTLSASLPTGIGLDIHLGESDAAIAMDHDQFCHLVWNLCLNSCRAMSVEGGKLTLSLSEAVPVIGAEAVGQGSSRLVLGSLPGGPCLCLTIADTGCGMDRETLSRIFEPFFTTAVVGEGRGLGLSVVHGLVQMKAGCILIESQVGEGTRMEIYLPIHQSPKMVAAS
jgi:signal transduction histidine kinase